MQRDEKLPVDVGEIARRQKPPPMFGERIGDGVELERTSSEESDAPLVKQRKPGGPVVEEQKVVEQQTGSTEKGTEEEGPRLAWVIEPPEGTGSWLLGPANW
jgi:hypothetical protein